VLDVILIISSSSYLMIPQETIEHLESVFPQLLNRPTSSIQFEIDTGFNNSEGKHQANWAAVSDAVWHDAMVETKPDTIRVSIDVTSDEQTRRASFTFILSDFGLEAVD
jgi:hypothetical protein